MQRPFYIPFVILLICVLSNSCRKDAEFYSLDPHLPGEWRTDFIGAFSGSWVIFYDDDHMDFHDRADSGTGGDDVHRSGNAKHKKGILYLGESKFKIEEYPVAFDTIIHYDIQAIQTHWRMKMTRVGNRKMNPKWDEYHPITYYK